MNRHGDVSAFTATPQGGAAHALAQAVSCFRVVSPSLPRPLAIRPFV